jgi:ribose transport system ATP-binding protein
MTEVVSSPEPSPATDLILVRGLSKRFGATQALADVDLDVRAGSVLALLGANGAGKSTVIKILAGVYTPDSGTVTVGGQPLGSPGTAGQISFIHQDLGLVDGLSVAENIALGTGYPRSHGLIGWRAARERAQRGLDIVGCGVDPRTRVSELSRTERSLVAIARALVDEARVLVLDEPTASLPVDETERLFTVLRRLRDSGMGLVYVSHRLDEVFDIADEMVVMRDGAVVRRARIADTTPTAVIADIVGRTPVPAPPPVARDAAEAALIVQDLVGERFGPLSLQVRRGEVLGLVGLAGAGHVEFGRTVVGALRAAAGTMVFEGRPYSPSGTTGAVHAGVGFVTSNRADEGLGMDLTVTENLLANPALRHQGALSFRRNRVEGRRAAELVHRFGIRPADPGLPVGSLSGGNQQKVILGRWLSVEPRLLVLEEPTAGVDVGAKSEIYSLLDDALGAGLAVILVSTDFEEVAAVSHRALVLRDGLVVSAIDRSQLSVTALVAAASGAAA